MIREADLVSYLPEFMQGYAEPVEALEAENLEFSIVWNAVDRALRNRFIATADEYGLSRFEKMLGLYPDVTDTLEIRRTRVQSRWFNAIPYTMRVLVGKLITMLGGEHHFSIRPEFRDKYELVLTVYTLDDRPVSEGINHLLAVTLPMNMVAGVIYESGITGNIYYGADMDVAEIIEIKQRKVL